MRRPRGRRGYTLAELMIVVAIIGIMAMVGPTIMIQVQNFYLMTTARTEIQRDARACLDIINRFLRQARASTIVIDQGAGGPPPYSRIKFTHIDGRNFEFSQNGSQLIQKINGKATVISSNLVYLAFTFPRSDYNQLVSVSMTMGKNIQLGKRKELELTIQKIRVMN